MKTALQVLILVCFSLFVNASDTLPTVSKGKIEGVKVFESEFVAPRSIDIWLPPGYSNEYKYDVLYMHDGQMLFDGAITWNKQEWRVDEVAGSLIEQGKVRPFIVVAIPNAGAGRHSEFFPQQPFERFTPAQQSALYQLERSPGVPLFNTQVYSDDYLTFIIKEVIPYVESHYSVNAGANHRFLAGSSMGGLVSLYGLMQYPNEFAGAICISTHWPGATQQSELVFKRLLTYVEQHLPLLKAHKIYFDHGDQTLDALYPELQKQIDNVFLKQQYPRSQWRSLYFPGENHSEASWSKRLNVPLEFMFNLDGT